MDVGTIKDDIWNYIFKGDVFLLKSNTSHTPEVCKTSPVRFSVGMLVLIAIEEIQSFCTLPQPHDQLTSSFVKLMYQCVFCMRIIKRTLITWHVYKSLTKIRTNQNYRDTTLVMAVSLTRQFHARKQVDSGGKMQDYSTSVHQVNTQSILK